MYVHLCLYITGWQLAVVICENDHPTDVWVPKASKNFIFLHRVMKLTTLAVLSKFHAARSNLRTENTLKDYRNSLNGNVL